MIKGENPLTRHGEEAPPSPPRKGGLKNKNLPLPGEIKRTSVQ